MHMSNPIALSPLAAAKIFSPALSERLVRKLIREGLFRPIMIGRRTYLLWSEIEEALRELGSVPS
jgi:hypothetical protein